MANRLVGRDEQALWAQISRTIKAMTYFHVLSLKVKGLSEPYRMGKFLEQHPISEMFEQR